ncbi:MAG: hypothetical protein GXO32_05515 [Crenarchaeota archaeon]|nr:hypothetical protein [Thermoproteota archaeon]
MLRDLLSRFRRREPSFERLDRDSVKAIFLALTGIRRDLVEAFRELKDRRMRDLYDPFSYMMLHFDKLHQFLRRFSGMPLYIGEEQLRGTCLEKGVDACIDSLSPEIAVVLRRIRIAAQILKKASSTETPSSIRSAIGELDSLVEGLARELMHALG